MNRLRQRLFVRALEDRTAPATFTVMNLNDSGVDSLRQAVLNANANSGTDLVTFDPVFFNVPRTITLTSGEIAINDAVTITGPGAALLTVSGNNASRIFNTEGASANAAIELNHMTLTQGRTLFGGGAIRMRDEVLTVRACTITNCLASGSSSGGAIEARYGKLVMEDSTVSANIALDNDGGAIRASSGSSVTLRRSTISGNIASSSGGACQFSGVGSFVLENCTLSGNTAVASQNGYADGGGAIAVFGSPTELLFRNCTLSGNSTSIDGGAVLLYVGASTAVFQNCTLTNNTAGKNGGALALYSNTGTLSLTSTIIAGNERFSFPSDIFCNVQTFIGGGGNNLIGAANVGNFTMTGPGNLTGTNSAPLDAKLGPLADNGGPTKTHMVLTTSPALNNGSNPAGLSTDQRGPGFLRVFNTAADIGAVEFQPPPLVVLNTNDSGAGSLRQAVIDANAVVGLEAITFDPAVFATPQTITLTSGEISITDSVSINGPGSSVLIISGNNASRIFNNTAAPTAAAISIVNLTLTAGNAGFLQVGGAIKGEDENLTLTDCALTANTAFRGGALHMSNGTLTATRSAFIGNSASSTIGGGSSGGIDMIGGGSKAVIRSCTISGNSALMHGGIYVTGYLNMSDTTVSGNSATSGFGGGIVARGTFAPGALTIRNCTISGNSANTDGGAVWFEGNATLVVQNSTITNNTAAGKGGGIHRAGYTANISLESTIVSGNINASAPDISSAGTVNVKTSAVGSGTGFIKTDLGGNLPFQPHANLKLGPLQNNGGLTLTDALLAGSPCLNVGSNPASLTTDQRGPGFPRSIGVTDMGAVEEQFQLVVTNINDTGSGSLRQAILNANVLSGADIITFDPTVFATPQTIMMLGTEMAITDSVVITSPAAALTINAGAKSRHFNIDGAGTLTVAITGMTLINGTSGAGDGGSIRIADEVVTLSKMTLTGNKAEGTTGDGGAITITAATSVVTILDSTISGNSATSAGGEGGGINLGNNGKLTMLRCIVSGNTAGEDGGGIYFFLGGTLVIDDSTVSGNTANKLTAGAGGGGIYLDTTTATIRNCTISGNSATNGGGIGIFGGGSTLIQNSTIAFNKATTAGGGITRTSSAAVTIESTIASDNSAPTGPDINGTIGTMNTSLVSNSAGLTVITGTGNLLNVNAKLGPLANNGGPTLTHALLSGSAAINNGSNPAGLTTDQRGNGFARSVGQTDIGAFEQIAAAKVGSVQINDGSIQRSRVTSLQISFSTQVTFTGVVASAFALSRNGGSAVGSFTTVANVVGGVTVVTLSTFGGAQTEFGSLIDGRYTLTVLASQLNNFDGNGDGTPGDDFVLIGDPATNKLFRLFGDADGDGTVAANDFIQFRLALGGSTAMFDFEGDGAVAASDFIQFRLRFGGSI